MGARQDELAAGVRLAYPQEMFFPQRGAPFEVVGDDVVEEQVDAHGDVP